MLVKMNLIPQILPLLSARYFGVALSAMGILVSLENIDQRFCDQMLSQQFIPSLVASPRHLWKFYLQQFSIIDFIKFAPLSDLCYLFGFLFQATFQPPIYQETFRLTCELLNYQNSDDIFKMYLESGIIPFITRSLFFQPSRDCIWYSCNLLALFYVSHSYQLPSDVLPLLHSLLSQDLDLESLSLICGCIHDLQATLPYRRTAVVAFCGTIEESNV